MNGIRKNKHNVKRSTFNKIERLSKQYPGLEDICFIKKVEDHGIYQLPEVVLAIRNGHMEMIQTVWDLGSKDGSKSHQSKL